MLSPKYPCEKKHFKVQNTINEIGLMGRVALNSLVCP